jgi:hypothetical protein
VNYESCSEPIECTTDGEMKGGCGQCGRCHDAARIYLKRFAEHSRELRIAANRLGRVLDDLPNECKSVNLVDRLDEIAKAIRGGRRVHAELPGEKVQS